MSWAAEEFKDIDLGDRRLDKRTVLLAERMAANPMASIPQACGDWAQTQAAYRLLAQDDIGWEAILAPHWQSAEARMRAHRVVLCIQATTELNFNGQRIAGLGPLSYEAQRGMYVHPTYAVSPEREPLGVLDAWMWAREPKDAQGKRGGLLESTRWSEGYRRIAELAGQLPDTRLVYVADREADIVTLMAQARDLGHRRRLVDPLPAQPGAARRGQAVGERDGGRSAGRHPLARCLPGKGRRRGTCDNGSGPSAPRLPMAAARGWK